VAHKMGALETKDLQRVAVDTTAQPKAIAHPTDTRLMHRALEKLVTLARRHGVVLRQSYVRVAKRAAIMVGRNSHAHQFKRARRALKFLRTRLGRVIRDINRKIDGRPELEICFGRLLDLAIKVCHQDHRQRGPKVYSLHAPEVECIGTGKARAPYEFGCKVSIATPVTSPKGGQFVLHARALHGNPFDGHTLGPVVADLERLTGVETRRIHVDKGYRGHNHPQKFRVWVSGQVRRVTTAIRREMKRRAVVEPVIGHLKAEHRMDRNHLTGREGDRINAVLSAAGYNFSLLLRWLADLLRDLIRMLVETAPTPQIGQIRRRPRSSRATHWSQIGLWRLTNALHTLARGVTADEFAALPATDFGARFSLSERLRLQTRTGRERIGPPTNRPAPPARGGAFLLPPPVTSSSFNQDPALWLLDVHTEVLGNAGSSAKRRQSFSLSLSRRAPGCWILCRVERKSWMGRWRPSPRIG
jgi:IS5 family transposase